MQDLQLRNKPLKAFGGVAPEDGRALRGVALIFSLQEYERGFSLQNTINQGEALCRSLLNIGFQVWLISDKTLGAAVTSKLFRRNFRRMQGEAKIDEHTVVVFAFFGHGVRVAHTTCKDSHSRRHLEDGGIEDGDEDYYMLPSDMPQDTAACCEEAKGLYTTLGELGAYTPEQKVKKQKGFIKAHSVLAFIDGDRSTIFAGGHQFPVHKFATAPPDPQIKGRSQVMYALAHRDSGEKDLFSNAVKNAMDNYSTLDEFNEQVITECKGAVAYKNVNCPGWSIPARAPAPADGTSAGTPPADGTGARSGDSPAASGALSEAFEAALGAGGRVDAVARLGQHLNSIDETVLTKIVNKYVQALYSNLSQKPPQLPKSKKELVKIILHTLAQLQAQIPAALESAASPENRKRWEEKARSGVGGGRGQKSKKKSSRKSRKRMKRKRRRVRKTRRR